MHCNIFQCFFLTLWHERGEFLPLFSEPDLRRTDFGQLFSKVKAIMIVPKNIGEKNVFTVEARPERAW